MYKVESAILLIAFNRLDTTRLVLESIASVQPDRLYVACDGARENKNEEHKVREVREWIMANITWPCEVKTIFREKNLGCKLAVSSAISWFFEQEEQGIILEDDCLPATSFYSFCDHLLEQYKDDERIMHIGGTNFQHGQQRGNASYYFSVISHVWGWASWRRAWHKYDIELKDLEEIRERQLFNTIVPNGQFRSDWFNCFTLVRDNKIDTWDFQWVYSVWRSNGLNIIPNTNLITNIGFGTEATHTFDADSKWANGVLGEIGAINHPSVFLTDIVADEYTMKQTFVKGNMLMGYLSKIKRMITGSKNK